MIAGKRIVAIGIVAIVLTTFLQFALAETPTSAANAADPAQEKLKERLAVLSEIVEFRKPLISLAKAVWTSYL